MSDEIDDNDAKFALQNIVGVTLEDMNENISTSIQGILDQLVTLKLNNQALKQNVEETPISRNKSTKGINAKLLNSDSHGDNKQESEVCYKVLIAEPSDLFLGLSMKCLQKPFFNTF